MRGRYDNDGDSIGNVCDNNPCYINVGIGSAARELTDTNCNGIPDNEEPTLIKLYSLNVTPKSSKIIISWNTETEIDNAGFNLYRAGVEDGKYIKINSSLIHTQGSTTQGATYQFIDNDVQNRKTYYYKLGDIDVSGKSTYHGPISSTPRLIYGLFK